MKELPQNYDAKTTEAKWQKKWAELGVYNWNDSPDKNHRSWENVAADKTNFVIDTPPPTVSGSLHMGHIYSYTQADFIARFQRMIGKNVFYPMGFDDNGLPTERLVEKTKKTKAHLHSREDFIKMCDEVAEGARKDFRNLFESIALSVDWNQEYHTISDESRRISQLSFLDLYKKGEVYRKLQPMFWDPIDQTAIAQAEIEEKELDSFENYIWFGLINDEQIKKHEAGQKISWEELEKVEIMTTRPELLAACVALVVHPDDAHKYKGKKAVTPLFNAIVPIIADDKVDKEKGTGVVMCCTFGDETDIGWWKKHNLETRVILNKFGKLDLASLRAERSNPENKNWIAASDSLNPPRNDEFFKILEGMRADHQDKKLSAKHKSIELLEQNGLTAREKKPIKHSVKCAERSGSPLELIPTNQWFVKVIDHKEDLKEKADECKWHPDFMRHRIHQWIDGLSWDWCISRQRYFGVPFPVWFSKRAGEEGKIIVADINKLPVNPLVDLPEGYTKDEVIPEADVMDTWATSSVSPQLSSKGINHYYSPHQLPPLAGGEKEGGNSHISPNNHYFGKNPDTSRDLNALEKAKTLRKNQTDVENKLWQVLRGKQLEGFKFRRQHPIGKYITDFVCLERSLIIELDGGQHADRQNYDAERTKFLNECGFKVLRFWNFEVNESLEAIVDTILYHLNIDKTHPFVLDPDRHQKLFPADLRPQAHEIIRTWAFYTIVKAYLHEDSIPWKNLMISGWCLAEDKSKMSKSKGNVVTPNEIIAENSADVVRYWASTSRLGADTAFSKDVLKIGRKLSTKLWNATKFAAIFLPLIDKEPISAKDDIAKGIITEPLDKWAISRLAKTIETATKEFENYEYSSARMAMEDFFWNVFCDNYLEAVKGRYYDESPENKQKRFSAIHTIYHALDGILRLFAPIMPHVTEELYQAIFDKKLARDKIISIHSIGFWPSANDYFIDEPAEKAGELLVNILNEVRKTKADKNVSVKYPVKKIKIQCSKKDWDIIDSIHKDLMNVVSANSGDKDLFFEFIGSPENIEIKIEVLLDEKSEVA